MQIEQLVYFVEVAKTCSVSAAAQNLFVSQPAISMSLKNLEKELGTALFNRSKSGVILTDLGKLFADQAKDFLICFEQFEKSTEKLLQNSPHDYQGELMIEAVPNVFYSFLEEVLNNFIKNFKNVKITLVEKDIDDVILDLMSCACDIGIVLSSEERIIAYPQLEFHAFLNTQEYVLLNRSHPLATRKFLRTKDLLPCSFVVYSFKKNDTNTIDYFFAEDFPEFQPNIVLTCSNLSLIKHNISCTDNVALISHLLVDTFTKESAELIALPLVNSPKLKMCGVYNKESQQKAIIDAFFDEFRTYY